MSSIFESLPGIMLPISEISVLLRDMWKGEENSLSAAPSEFRASQLNLIIHFGSETGLEEAQSIFDTAIEFTQRHPGRIIILCPTALSCENDVLQGKLFTQCYIGESQREMCCCEALLLEYCPNESRSLFNQVSVWLESDLPVYHWFHRVRLKEVKNKYLSFVKNSKRVLFDSQVETDDYGEIPIEDTWRIRDIADARVLPIKQSIGQVLSTFDAQAIISGLTGIKLFCDTENKANTGQVKKWLNLCLSETTGYEQLAVKPVIDIETSGDDSSAFKIVFEYNNSQVFTWTMTKNGKYASTETSIDGCSSKHCFTLRKTDSEAILSEVIFLGR